MSRQKNRFISIITFCVLVGLAAAQGAGQITEIVINGNKNINKEAILGAMRTKVGSAYDDKQLSRDKDSILSMGFFKAADVRPSLIDGNNWRAIVDVSEFEIVKEIRIVGNTVIKTEDILKLVQIEVGKVFNLKSQKPTGDAITKLYTEKGFLSAITQLGPTDDAPSTVSIEIVELKVGTITVTGNTRTQSKVISRMIKTKPGDVYSDPRWISDLQRLFSTQWFEKITPTDKQAADGVSLDLAIDLKEARTGNIVFGATMDPRASFGGMLRLSETNFRGSGQTIEIEYNQAVTAGGGPSVNLGFSNPFMDSKGTSMNFGIYSRIIHRFGSSLTNSSSGGDTYTERRTGVSAGMARPIGEKANFSLGVRYEGIKTTELNVTNPQSFVRQDGTMLLAQFGYVRNNRDLDIDPSRGDWLSLLVEPGFANISTIGGALTDPNALGPNNFVRSSIEYKSYLTSQPRRTAKDFDASRRVLAFRAKFGTITGKVPFYEQFFAGGSDTVRGYADDQFWGRQTLLATLEYRHPIQKSFNIIPFIDYGGAWGGFGTVNGLAQSDKMKLHLGYGLGFSFKTPLGPIRLDFGFNENGKTRTHFLIGTSF
ncbi:MAG: BamA/TamA family outer membrane protein [Fimbriimonadaceae bacterium]